MNHNNHTIDLNITLTSPLHLAYPDNSVALNPQESKKKVNLTVKKPLNFEGDQYQIPYVPANGFRGGLRRKAMARVMEKLNTEARVSESLYLGLCCGASSGSPDKSMVSVEELLRARNNVYMGLYGGAARILESSYKVSDLNPVLDLTVKAGAVPSYCKDLVQPRRQNDNSEKASYIEPWQLTKGIVSMIRVDDLARVSRPDEIMAYIESPIESVSAHQDAIRINNDERQEGTASKESVANMMAFETIATGTQMHLGITIERYATEGQIGLLLYSLNDLIRENELGGMNRLGVGTFRVDAFKLQLGDSLGGESVNALELGGGEEFNLPVDATIARLLQAADQGLSELTIAEMQSYFTDFSKETKESAKLAKKNKTAKA